MQIDAMHEAATPHRLDDSSALQQQPDPPSAKQEKKPPALSKDGRIDPTQLPNDPVGGSIIGADAGRWNRKGALFVTAKQVDALLASGDLSKLDPMIPAALWPLVQALAQALTPDGTLGSRGPLSSRGPVGNHAWNPSELFRAFGDWRAMSLELMGLGGPGSSFGSLGPFGADGAWAKSMLPLLGPIASQLQAGGIFGVLGPDGPLGPKGPLGYLGRVGGHGFAQDASGNFISKQGIERKTQVEYLGEKRTMNLVELYRESDAAKVKNQDASWVIDGLVDKGDDDGDSFKFHVKKGDLLTLTVVPERVGDVFTLELFDKKGRLVAVSDSDRFVNFVQAKAPVGGELTARVKVKTRGPDSESVAQSPVAAWVDMLLAPVFGSEIGKRPSGAYRLVCS